MNKIQTEMEYEDFILDYLHKNNKFIVRKNENYDRDVAMDTELLLKFLEDTQPQTVTALKKIYRSAYEQTIINYIDNTILQKDNSLINVLKNGVELNGYQIKLMYNQVATDFNPELTEKYNKNILSVAKEVWINDTQRIDLVLFLNGIAIMTVELKCNFAGQSYEDAIYQYRFERDEKNRIFRFKKGALVNFAMDLNEVYMCTRLNGGSSYFLPFNMGNGKGIDTGKGNPVYPDKYSAYYMWDDIFTKDTIIELVSKYIFIEKKEKKDEETGKTKITETLIFPRFHQLDCLRKVLADVKENKTSQNYLIQHSAGSGKTNTIAWLAHRLSSFHDADNKQIYDNIVIVTDRVVVDRQLQKAVMALDHKTGKVRVMDDKSNSDDLRKALEGNTKIIATTIQKFPYILDTVKGLNNKKFAVIIDEAHSSTAGKDMAAVNKALGSDVDYEDDAFNMDTEDIIVDELSKSGKRPNVSVFAFTATPKATTLQLFGIVNAKGQREAFHLYSMKQAIEEGFILDVLQSYTTYETFYQINKEIEDDPKFKTNAAKKKIARFVALHETNIAQRIEIIIEHFRTTIMEELGGQAKAMVITSSRAEAVKYSDAFNKYTREKGYDNIHSLVAFSGKVTDKQLGLEGDKEYTETSLNGFSESSTAKQFDEGDYQVLIVANKYQTGFDQPKLCAMYILKRLNGVNAVQTLSRLNRICPPYDKKVFILDFVNSYEEIEKAFKPYYTATILTNSVNPELVYEIEAKVDSYYLASPDDIESFNEHLYKKPITPEDRTKLNYYLEKSKKVFDNVRDEKQQREIYLTLRRFVRFYEFLIQVSCFEDVNLHKKYNFLSYLLSFLQVRHSGGGFSLKDKITATNFVQKKKGTVTNPTIQPNPVVKLPTAETFILSEDKEKKLSEIIAEINARSGNSFNNDDAVRAMLDLRDAMKKDENLRKSAHSNSLKDFEYPFYDKAEDALLEGYNQRKELCNELLKDNQALREVLGIFLPEIYKSLKDEYEKKDKD